MLKLWQCVNLKALMSIVTTYCQSKNKISGSWVHWKEDWIVSVMKVRQAQEFSDHEIIVNS